MNKLKDFREWLNLILTIAGGCLIWAANIKLDNQRMSIQADTAEKYVRKSWYETDRAETNKRLDIISADIGAIKIDIAKIQGRQSRLNSPKEKELTP